MLKEENLDVAGEFIVMAATLIQIKSRMILPVDVEDDEEEIEEEDPRIELVEKLLEYRRFRDLAEALGQRQEAAMDRYGRQIKPKYEYVEDEEEMIEVGLYDLIKAMRSVLRFLTQAEPHQILGEGASVDAKITFIEDALTQRQTVTWRELHENCRSQVEIVCCLLAILELCHMKRIRIHQHHMFGDIRIFARTDEEAHAEDNVHVAAP